MPQEKPRAPVPGPEAGVAPAHEPEAPATPAASPGAGKPAPEAGAVPPGTYGVQLKTHNFTLETLERAHELGFRAVRRGFYWDKVEAEKGAYDFSDYDAQMRRAKELGLAVVGVLFSGNKHYEDDGRGGIQTEAGRTGFAAFAAALAARYREQDVIWEVWNEPNVRTFWRKDGKHNSDDFAGEYTALVKAVVPAMLAADPDCFVVAGSVSNYWEPSYRWTESCFRKGILKTGIRGWSVHPYGVKTPEEFAVGHGRTRELLEKYGAKDLPLVDTERGFAVKERAEGWSGGSKDRALEFQAWNFVRQFLVDQLCDVRLTIWYEWDGEEFGLVHDDRARPVYAACRTMLVQLDGYRVVRRLESDSDLDYAVLMRNEAGDRKLVAWTAPPPGGSPDEAVEHEAAIGAAGPDGGLPATLEGFRLLGEAESVAVGGDSVRLVLSGAPRYVVIPPGVELGRCKAGAVIPRSRPEAARDGEPAERAAGAVDLGLFDGGVGWKFVENTGKGSFAVRASEQGKGVGVLEYDFTESKNRSTPYVMATAPVEIAEGAKAFRISARSPIRQRLTFRLIDRTGQTHQYKGRITGSGRWETIRIPLTRRLEHWGGAKDGRIHFPVKSVVLSVPLPGPENRTGKVEYSAAIVHYE
ncbi:MAG: cellulase family glycosylhydrolase [Planctomycetota bacterium]